MLLLVVVIVRNYCAAAVGLQLRHLDRWKFKVTASRLIIDNVVKAEQCVRLVLKITISKDPDDSAAPDFFGAFLFKENWFPCIILSESYRGGLINEYVDVD